jgi:hypothetical protein
LDNCHYDVTEASGKASNMNATIVACRNERVKEETAHNMENAFSTMFLEFNFLIQNYMTHINLYRKVENHCILKASAAISSYQH